jgi:hypothetical protein
MVSGTAYLLLLLSLAVYDVSDGVRVLTPSPRACPHPAGTWGREVGSQAAALELTALPSVRVLAAKAF